ncbi:MAG TPA: outer membrane beta-barrel protein [Ignavibacteria bacterium]|nr:outer membrane beta-barrel protein [Ignavibacteria bacterium]
MKQLIFISLVLLPSISNSQNFIAVGGRIGYTFYNSVWDLQDPAVTNFYPNEPKFYNSYLGVYGEFFGKKYLSTCADVSYHNTSYSFEYNMKNNTGEVIGTNKINTTLQYISVLIQEKIKYGKPKGPEVFFKAGPRVEFQIKKNIDKDFQYIFNDANKTVFGYTLTGGAAWNFTSFQVVAEGFWHGDITKIYSSGFGKLQNNAFGVSLSVGWLNKKK